MRKRIVIYILCFFVAVVVLLGYFWLKERQIRAETARDLNAFFADELAKKNALESLGDIELNPPDLSLGKLEEKLHQPSKRKPGSQNTTRLGWACGQEQCSIWASFLVPFGQEISPNLVPAALVVMSPPFGDFHNVSFGGVHLGDKVEAMMELCLKRGYGRQIGSNRMSWNKDWNVAWGEVHGKVFFLTFYNEKMMKNVGA
jgi:hypothetical protein